MKHFYISTRILLLALLSIFVQINANAQDCMRAWENRVPIEIDNSAGVELTDYQVRFEIDTETPILLGLMEPDGSDIRVTMSSCCDPLCYYIESGINTATTVIWVNVPLIEAASVVEIFAFFGNPGVEAVSDVECVFDFYEGFDDDLFNFIPLCGDISDSTVTDGDFNLAWTDKGMLGSNITFPFDVAYTAEVMMNSATGNWPGIFWAKETAHKNYGLMAVDDLARISLTGGGTSYCDGHNWASPLVAYTETAGLWSFTWIETGSLVADFPTAGEIVSSNVTYAKDEDLRLLIGGISFGTGALNMDWVRVRKYAAIPPVISVGALDGFAPAADIALPDDIIGCETAILDAGDAFEIYDWSTGGDLSTEEVAVSDTYYITVIDSEGCIQYDSTTVVIGSEYEESNSDMVCLGGSYTFPDGFVMEEVLEATIYISSFTTEDYGCDSIITTTLGIYDFSPVLDLGADILSCGDTVFIDAGDGFGSYEWNDGGTSQYDTVLTTGTYSVMVTDDNGCEQSDEIAIEVIYIDNGTTLSEYTITSDQAGATYQWLNCDADFAEIEGETDMSMVAIANGNYAVEVTIGECVDTSGCVEIAGLSINENRIEANLFSVYPNPSSGQFNVVLKDLAGEVTVKITSVDGKIIETKTTVGNQTIPFSISGASGIYFVEVIHNQSSQVIKIVKE